MTNLVLWWPNLLWEVELCWDWEEGSGCLLLKKMNKKEGEMGEGRGGSIAMSYIKYHQQHYRQNYYIINSVDHSINKMSHHCMICLFEHHCNIFRHSLGIYQENLFVGVFSEVIIVGLIPSVMLFITVTCLHVVWLFFFISYFPTVIPLIYNQRIFLSVFTDE
jgi:hypothetical protein